MCKKLFFLFWLVAFSLQGAFSQGIYLTPEKQAKALELLQASKSSLLSARQEISLLKDSAKERDLLIERLQTELSEVKRLLTESSLTNTLQMKALKEQDQTLTSAFTDLKNLRESWKALEMERDLWAGIGIASAVSALGVIIYSLTKRQ